MHPFLYWHDIFYLNMVPILEDSQRICLWMSRAWVDGALRCWANDDITCTYHLMHHGHIFYRKDTWQECKVMGVEYVQAIVDSLNEGFPNLPIFNALKLLVQSTIQMMKKLVSICRYNGWRN
jgi:hypothetical protein